MEARLRQNGRTDVEKVKKVDQEMRVEKLKTAKTVKDIETGK